MSPEKSVDPITPVRAGIVDVLILAPIPVVETYGDDPAEGGRWGWQVLGLRRAEGTRCTGAWEIVHGRIERGERPEEAALREVREETGLVPDRLYSITVNPFYLVATGSVELAVVFAAIVPAGSEATLSSEHDLCAWLTIDQAMRTLAWPRERDALMQTMLLLATGDAGPLEDVLLIR